MAFRRRVLDSDLQALVVLEVASLLLPLFLEEVDLEVAIKSVGCRHQRLHPTLHLVPHSNNGYGRWRPGHV